MSDTRENIVTPIGRFVGGSLTRMFDKDMQGNPKKNPNWFIAVAFAKNQPSTIEFINKIWAVAQSGYGNNPGIMHAAKVAWENGFGAGFAWKIDDGDNPKYADRKGYAGHFVVGFSTTLDIQTVGEDNSQIDPKMIELGYYVDIACNCAINGNTDHTAGVYINPQVIRFRAYGEKIFTTPSASVLMANAPASQLPPGASMTPLDNQQQAMPAPGQQQAMPAPGQQQGYQQQAMPAPGQQQQYAALQMPGNGAPGAAMTGQVNNGVPMSVGGAPTAYPSNVAPHHQFVNGPGQQQAPGAVGMPDINYQLKNPPF